MKNFKGDKWSSNKFMGRKPSCRANAPFEHIYDLGVCSRPYTVSDLNNSILWIKVIRFKKSNLLEICWKLNWNSRGVHNHQMINDK